jgi:hypothetical protein
MKKMYAFVVAFLATMGLVTMAGVSPAAAYTGSWTNSYLCSAGISYNQGHYQYDSTLVRADGYGVQLTSGHGYIRQISTVEGQASFVVAHRDINFTGSQTYSAQTGISESYLPFLYRPGHYNWMWVYVLTSTNETCSVSWDLP